MQTRIKGAAYQLHDLWIAENAAGGTLTGDGDPWTIMYEAKQFNLKLAKAIGDDNPLFNDNGALFLAAYMASKLVRGSGSVGDLAARISDAGTVFSEEAGFHTGPIAEILTRAAGLPVKTLVSALESVGFMETLAGSASIEGGKLKVHVQ